MTGVVVLLAVLGLTLVLGLVHRSWDGRLRTRSTLRSQTDDLRPLLSQSGERATLVQFSSAFCAPCRATRRVLTGVAEQVPGVLHVEIDAEDNLELVRRLGIVKTPTTLVLDADGREVVRATGQPRSVDVLAAIGKAVTS